MSVQNDHEVISITSRGRLDGLRFGLRLDSGRQAAPRIELARQRMLICGGGAGEEVRRARPGRSARSAGRLHRALPRPTRRHVRPDGTALRQASWIFRAHGAERSVRSATPALVLVRLRAENYPLPEAAVGKPRPSAKTPTGPSMWNEMPVIFSNTSILVLPIAQPPSSISVAIR
jgi:hypothetical protein